MTGMMLHQDGSSPQWGFWQGVAHLIITFDDATSEHYSMFFVLEEGTDSSFRGVRETIEKKGCSARYTRIEEVTIGIPQKRTNVWIRPNIPNLGEQCVSWVLKNMNE